MRALVIGCGSIGKIHISNLLKLKTIKCITIYTKNTHCLEGIETNNRVNIITSQSDGEVDFAIIANETNKHLASAVELAERGINLFVEKPLSHNLENVDMLNNIIEEKGLKLFVAYNLRYLGAIKYIKEQLSRNILGDLYFSKIEAGQYLPLWRPDRDYRDSYSSAKVKGGGVALDLSHEVDYMRYLFGDPCYWKVIKGKVSDLEIDSDDIFEGIYMYHNNFICNVHMDYLQLDKKREIRIVGSEGTLICDFVKEYIRVTVKNKELFLNNEDMFDLNRTYMDELIHFIDSVKKGIEPAITFDDGIKALKLLEDGNNV